MNQEIHVNLYNFNWFQAKILLNMVSNYKQPSFLTLSLPSTRKKNYREFYKKLNVIKFYLNV